MKKITRLKGGALLLMLASSVFQLQAQKEDKAIKEVINHFFEAMQSGDTATLKNTCTEEPVLQTYMKDKDGDLQIFTENFNDFVKFVGNPGTDKFKEEITFDAIHTEMSLASVWTPYTFYLNGKVSHCGTNSFQLIKTAAGWKIQYIIDTRRKGCK
jgi:hypothetical protein